jgi:hypothetical protein
MHRQESIVTENDMVGRWLRGMAWRVVLQKMAISGK